MPDRAPSPDVATAAATLTALPAGAPPAPPPRLPRPPHRAAARGRAVPARRHARDHSGGDAMSALRFDDTGGCPVGTACMSCGVDSDGARVITGCSGLPDTCGAPRRNAARAVVRFASRRAGARPARPRHPRHEHGRAVHHAVLGVRGQRVAPDPAPRRRPPPDHRAPHGRAPGGGGLGVSGPRRPTGPARQRRCNVSAARSA